MLSKYGWDTELDDPPITYWRIVPDERLAWIRGNMDHVGIEALEPACTCGRFRSEEHVATQKGYTVHGIPTAFCYRHQRGL